MAGKRPIPRGRVERAVELFLSPKTDRQIVNQLRSDFGVSARQAARYLALAKKRVTAEPIDVASKRAQVEALLVHAYEVAEIGTPERGPQVNAMVAAAGKLADIHGVNAPQRIEHSGSVGPSSADELHGRIAAIVARASGDADASAAGAPDDRRAN